MKLDGDHIKIKNQKYVSPDVIKEGPIKEVQTELVNIQSDAVFDIKEEVNILKAIGEALEKKAKEPQMTP